MLDFSFVEIKDVNKKRKTYTSKVVCFSYYSS